MASPIQCSRCKRDLLPHCPNATCGWYSCSNRTCPAHLYDVTRGVLVYVDNRVERLGSS